jgi:DNA topoisomerase I
MSYELIITEKPSAAMKIAYALADSKPVKMSNNGAPYYMISHKGQDLVVVCAVGHLFGVAETKHQYEYPSFNIEWKPTSESSNGASYSKKYALSIEKMAKDAKSFVVACDYDIEGEVIGLNCVRFLCKQKDAGRMKFSTLTKPDLIAAYESKTKNLNWGQANAGETRHFLDWLYGINLSRALTQAVTKNGTKKTLSTGRVQGPALKLIVDREKEIQVFKPTPYWTLSFNGVLNETDFNAKHEKEKFLDIKEVNEVFNKINGKNGLVKSFEKNDKEHFPPFAFDLTTLQMESYRSLRINPKQTLALAQSLYLAGKISYPRTSSQKLPPTIGYKKILESIKENSTYSKICQEILGKEKIYPRQGGKSDPAHPAIYPTGTSGEKLNGAEKKVYDLIVRRFLSAFGDSAKRVETIIETDVEGEKFVSSGTITVEKGWYVYYGSHLKINETQMPEAKKGDSVKIKDVIKEDKETEPPRRYSPASILKELETRNLGTKSTRAQIIDTLYQRDFIKGTRLEATTMGISIIDTLSKYSPKIVDEKLTSHIEEEMQEIRDGKKTKDDVLNEVKEVLIDVLKGFKENEKNIGKELVEAQKITIQSETLGDCPNCENGKLLIKRGKFGRFVACNNYPDCKSAYNIPKMGFIEPSGNNCKECKVPTVLVKFKGRKKEELCMNNKCLSKQNGLESEEEEKECPKCKKGVMKLRSSMYGQFYGCSNYPKCRNTEKIVKPGDEKKVTKKKSVIKKKAPAKKKTTVAKKVSTKKK